MTFLFSFKKDICKTSLGNPGLDSRLSTALSYGNHTFIKNIKVIFLQTLYLKYENFLKQETIFKFFVVTTLSAMIIERFNFVTFFL